MGFAGIASMCLNVFKCKPNPNHKWNLIVDRSIVCNEQEWMEVLGMSIAAVVVECLLVLLLFVYIIFIAPSRFHDRNFQMRWKFLFVKYRPDVYWWSLPIVLKPVLFNFCFIIGRNGVSQLYLIWIV